MPSESLLQVLKELEALLHQQRQETLKVLRRRLEEAPLCTVEGGSWAVTTLVQPLFHDECYQTHAFIAFIALEFLDFAALGCQANP